MDPGVRCLEMKANPTWYLWSKYECFLISGCQDIRLAPVLKTFLSLYTIFINVPWCKSCFQITRTTIPVAGFVLILWSGHNISPIVSLWEFFYLLKGSLVQSAPNSNSVQTLWLSLLSESMKKIQSKMGG